MMSVTEVADAIGLNRKTLYQLVREGTCPLPFVRLGQTIKFKRADVEMLLGTTTQRTGGWSLPIEVLERTADLVDAVSRALRAHIETTRTGATPPQPPVPPRTP